MDDHGFGPPPPDARDGLRAPLTGVWYAVDAARALRGGRLASVTVLGEQIVLGRGPDGAVFALRDRCPHRGMPLSRGRLVAGELTCPFHGWRFNTGGRCTGVPALAAGEAAGFERITVPAYDARESGGLVWLRQGPPAPAAPPIPEIGFAHRRPLIVPLVVEASFDLAALSLVDPAHVAFVHDSWWFRPGKSFREKVKQFAPTEHGFVMKSHRSGTVSPVYRLLGGVPDIEIEFRLPGVRIERIRVGDRRVVNLTVATPIDGNRTWLINALYWNWPVLDLARSLGRPFARAFLGQDKTALDAAQQGLDRKPTMVLMGNADLPGQWYFALKKAFLASAGGAGFENPLQPTELTWRS